MAEKIIIDTDPGQDDAVAILLALASPELEVLGITTVAGNVPLPLTTLNALKILELAGRADLPVFAGCEAPLRRRLVTAEHVHGKTGLDGIELPVPATAARDRHAVDFIVETLRREPAGSVTLVPIGPLTNIATAWVKEPRIADNLKHLWVMGGLDNSIGNTTPASEFNFYVDPEAAKIVVNAGFNLTLSTWTLTMSSGLLPDDKLRVIEAMDTPLSRFFMAISQAPFKRTEMRYGRPLSTHPDSLTCACAIDHAIMLETADCLVDVETQGELTRAYSSICTPLTPAEAEIDFLWPSAPANARCSRGSRGWSGSRAGRWARPSSGRPCWRLLVTASRARARWP